MEKLEDIESKIQTLRRKEQAIKERAFKEKLPEHKKLIGRCFKYRNSYGSGDKGWWLYGKVVGVSQGYCGPDDVFVAMRKIQKCTYKKISFEDKCSMGGERLDGWIEISESEFNKQKKKLINEAMAF